jgi:hypothetical protein
MSAGNAISVICKGTLPGSSIACGNELVRTDGVQFFIANAGIVMVLELDPPRIVCSKCGYKTRLNLWLKLQQK